MLKVFLCAQERERERKRNIKRDSGGRERKIEKETVVVEGDRATEIES